MNPKVRRFSKNFYLLISLIVGAAIYYSCILSKGDGLAPMRDLTQSNAMTEEGLTPEKFPPEDLSVDAFIEIEDEESSQAWPAAVIVSAKI